MKPIHLVVRGCYGTVGKTVTRAIANGFAGCAEPLGLLRAPSEILSRARLTLLGHKANIHVAADMIRKDSLHGFYPNEIKVDEGEGTIRINGVTFEYQQGALPQVPWQEGALRVVIEGVGDVKDAAKDGPKVLRSDANPGGADVIVATTTLKGAKNYVRGINDGKVREIGEQLARGENPGEKRAFGSGSCTTNATSPLLVVSQRALKVEELVDLTTIHSFTGSQSLVDRADDKPERGRSAAVNMLFTTTNAAEIAKVLKGEMAPFELDSAVAIRGPWSEGSVVKVIMEGSWTDARVASAAIINDVFAAASEEPGWSGILGYVPKGDIRVSSDFIIDPRSSSFDANQTTLKILQSGRVRVKLHGWYANAFAVPHRSVELAVAVADAYLGGIPEVRGG